MASTVAQIYTATEAAYHAEEVVRRTDPVMRFWDAEWALHHSGGDELSAKFSWISNDTGPGQTEHGFNTPVAQWIYDYQGRLDRGEGRGVFVTVDYCGARWSGSMDKYVVEQKENGETVLIVDWAHDHEFLKYYTVTSNPIMPDAFQFPRAWLIAGPVTWTLRISLFMAIWRSETAYLTFPDDPMDLANWVSMGLDQSNWQVVVAPLSFIDAMASGVVWSVATARWTNYHDMAYLVAEDAEISITCTRWLTGDDDPWVGANLRHGALVIDFVDKSGIQVGTSHGGNIFDGLERTVVEFADDFIDSTLNVVADADTPTDYYLPNNKYTDPIKPYVIFHEGGGSSPIQASQWVYSPTKCVTISMGGHSTPGVNEVISATIQAVGDIIGNLVQIGSLGGTIDAVVAPLYTDTILAWLLFKSTNRAANMGWSRHNEYFQDGGGKAYTIASMLVIRAGMWATKAQVSWSVEVADGRPFMIGSGVGTTQQGVGHFFLDDRVGLVLEGDPDGKIHMDRCRKLEMAWGGEDGTAPPEWKINIGDPRIWEDPAQKSLGKLERLLAGLHDLGVN
jgi:hypothetical protein